MFNVNKKKVFAAVFVGALLAGSNGWTQSSRMEGTFDYRQVESAGRPGSTSTFSRRPRYNRSDPNLNRERELTPMTRRTDQFRDIRQLDKYLSGKTRSSGTKAADRKR
jgi:hypothetical protein